MSDRICVFDSAFHREFQIEAQEDKRTGYIAYSIRPNNPPDDEIWIEIDGNEIYDLLLELYERKRKEYEKDIL